MSKEGSQVEGKIAQIGITAERIELGDFLKDKSKLEQLRYNVMTDSEDENLADKITSEERRNESKSILAGLRSSGEHEAIYVAKDGEKILGLLAIGFHGGEAIIEQFWSVKPEATQHDIVAALVAKAQSDLPKRAERSYSHLIIPRGEDAKVSTRLKHLAADPTISNFLRFRKSANDNKPQGDKIAA